MKGKRAWAIIGGIALIIVLAVAYAMGSKGDMPQYDQSGSSTASQQDTPPANPALMEGRYLDYSIENSAGSLERRWLFFHAGWCPQCRALDQDIKSGKIPDGITILKVDYDKETDLKKHYGVTLQTTIVEIDQEGKELRKFVAYDEPTLAAVVNALGE